MRGRRKGGGELLRWSGSREKADMADKGRRRWRRPEAFKCDSGRRWSDGREEKKKPDSLCKMTLFHLQGRPGLTLRSHLELCPPPTSLSLSPPSPVLFPTPAPFIPLLLIPLPLFHSFPPSLPPSTSPAAVLWRRADVEVSITERMEGTGLRVGGGSDINRSWPIVNRHRQLPNINAPADGV